MTLIVAAIHDGDQVTMASDTKISFYDRAGLADERRTRDTYFNAFPKIVLLRSDLIVGVAGDDPNVVIEDLVTHRSDDAEALLEYLVSVSGAEFVVAATSPTRLWSVRDGQVDDRTDVGRAWGGDPRAYDVFRNAWEQWPDGMDVPFLLMSSMQFLTTFDPVASVGGFTLIATSHQDGFHFQSRTEHIGPSRLELNAVDVSPGHTTLRMGLPRGGDATTHEVHVLPGLDPTRGSLGFLIPQAGAGLLFRHERPWAAVQLKSSTPQELIAAAQALGDIVGS